MRRLAALLLLATGCLQEPGPAPLHPSYTAGRRVFVSVPSLNCTFTSDGRYAVVGDGEQLLFMELAHGRVHGSVPFSNRILLVEEWPGINRVFAVTPDSVFSVTPGSFTVNAGASIPGEPTGCGFSGGRLFLAFTDGMVRGYDPVTLQEEVSAHLFPGPALLAGTPALLIAGSDSSIGSFRPEDLAPVDLYEARGRILHLASPGGGFVSACIAGGNEVALLALPGLWISSMFTVTGTPLAAAVDPAMEYALAFTDRGVLAAVGPGGGIDWRTEEFGEVGDLAISADGWNALVLSRQALVILEK